MKKQILISFSLLMILSLFLSACASQPAPTAAPTAAAQAPAANSSSTTATQAPAANTQPIWLALIYPMTGDNAQYGAIEVRAHKYVIDQINAQGGINGRQVQYQVFDDQGDPQQAATIAQKVVGDPKFVAAFGHYRSVCTLAAAPIYNEAKFLLLTDSVNGQISGISPYIFRYSITDTQAGQQLVWAAIKNHPEYKTAAIIYTQSDYGVGLNQIIAPELKTLGVNLVDTESYFEGQSKDYTPQLTKIKAANPDVIFLLGYYSEGAEIVQQAHQLGMTQTFWGPDGLDNQGLVDLGGKDVESNVYVTAYFSDGMTYPGVADTIKDFKAKTGVDLDGFSAITVDATKLLLQGIAAVGTDKTKLRDWLASEKDFVGVAGPVAFDKNNDNMRRIVVLQVKNGVFVPSKEQVSDAYFQGK
ncbi:MAG: ABC transporter substrate-binding protein [Anaerolineaceae bacterium]|nr:ABC transporter substrate-binding protein [Anaerolineaceae bacterium]